MLKPVSYTHDPWTRSKVWGWPEVVGGAGWRGAKGMNLDNYNSLINNIQLGEKNNI